MKKKKDGTESVTPAAKPVKVRRTHKVKMTRIHLNISDGLLAKIDEAADKDFTTRSELIRAAMLWYLRPQGRELAQVDPTVILETLKRRQILADVHKQMREDEFLKG